MSAAAHRPTPIANDINWQREVFAECVGAGFALAAKVRQDRLLWDAVLHAADPGPLRDEMAAARFEFRDLKRLETLGVPGLVSAKLHADFGIAVAQVALQARGELWEPEGPDARLLLAVRDAAGAVIDIAAVSTSHPDQWALRTGVADLLGWDVLDDIDRQLCVKGFARLRLFGNPLDWLRGGCAGVCVLDWKVALPVLRTLGERVELCCDAGGGPQLKSMLAHASLPRVKEVAPIRVPEHQLGEAA